MTNKIGKCGKIILEDAVKFAKDDARQTAKDFRDIGAFVGNVASKSASRVYTLIREKPAVLMYPITGQLSAELNERIERTLGSENYSAEDACMASIVLNSSLMAALMSYICYKRAESNPDPDPKYYAPIAGIIYSMLYSVPLEFLTRLPCCTDGKKRYCASLPGKAVSMAITPVVRTYDYLKGVHERAVQVERK